jgi:tripartite-type tricarboxylate transporter receptor subunit TctC
MLRSVFWLLTLVMQVTALPAWTQTASYPARPVRLVNPYPPGASADFVARTIATKLSERLGQPIVVENKAGGGTLIGTDFVAKAPADGYTVLFTAASAITVQPHLHTKLPFDPFKDFVHVVQVCDYSNLLTVHPSVKAGSLRDLLALARANPGKITFASTGQGTGTHLVGEMFKVAAGIDITHVPYKGGGPALNDLLGGRVDMMINPATSVLPHIRAGKLRALAVTSARRLPVLPEVPTVSEAGVKDFEHTSSYGLSVPRATPPAIVAKLNAETRAVVSSPDVAEKFIAQGLEPRSGTSEEFTSALRKEWEENGSIIRRIGLKAE